MAVRAQVRTVNAGRGGGRAATGISGFDDLTGGGLPRAATTLVIGGPGTGKTVFALQQLARAAAHGEPGVFVSFEEDPRRLLANVGAFGWGLAPLLAARGARRRPRLAMLDARLSPDTVRAGGFDLDGLLAIVGAEVTRLGARRIVFDGIDVLLALLDDAALERHELYRLHRWLIDRGLTALVTAKSDDAADAPSGHYGFMQFMVDCLVRLDRGFVDRMLVRSLRVLKYRGGRVVGDEAPFSITARGIEVANVTLDDLAYPASTRRVSSGVAALDAMLDGGYFRGSATLISGAPGTAKSTLAGAFLAAACAAGGRGLLVAFDEAGSEMIRNLTSVGIRLAPHERAGRLRILAPRANSRSADEHLIAIEEWLRTHRPTALVVDPVSALVRGREGPLAIDATQRLVRTTKALGITTVLTSLLDAAQPEAEATRAEVSTLADTWIHLNYLVRGGERNRALTIIKSRGTAHSNQVRELVLGARGPTLTDVYCVGGAVLMGTARWEAEAAQEAEQRSARAKSAQRERELELTMLELSARSQTLAKELGVRAAELEALRRGVVTREEAWAAERTEIRRRRLSLGPAARRGRGR